MPVTVNVTLTLDDAALAGIASAVAQMTSGAPGVPPALQGVATVVGEYPTQPAPGTGQVSPGAPYAAPASQPATAPPSDPWAQQNGYTAPQNQASGPVPTAPNAGWSQQAPGAYSAPPAAPPSSASSQQTDKWGNTYTFGLPNAHTCKHGERAALKSGTSQKGQPYTAWVCARSFADYKNKCDFYAKA